ncbi:Tctex1 domain-containing protein 2 [Lunasporangiospora selenospora]|uniref:Tctex1 domain-containing protein 2 n=1 Tax=Lunasporangiospora selenospora TaxID=979761 RepID=A0A9P6FKV8_9FUNG|nr:Tctex1 domain-containing protein 2 [Lunasporangiospora selenospora]
MMERVGSLGSTASSDEPISPAQSPSLYSNSVMGSAPTSFYNTGHHPSDLSSSSSNGQPVGHMSVNSDRDSTISLRPTFMQKFRPAVAIKFMQQVLLNHLQHKTYNPESTLTLSKTIAEEIKAKLIELDLGRYKYVVNVVIGENLGGGARMDAQCHWDQESDGSAQAFFSNDSLWCAAVAFAVFYY